MGPRDSSQGQEKTWRTDGEQGGGRCQLTHPLPQASPGDDLRALNNLFQIQAAPPPLLQARGGREPGALLPREEPSPSSQQEAQGATSQTTGVTAAPHRVMKDLGQRGRARGGGIIITSEAAAAQLPVCPSAPAFG